MGIKLHVKLHVLVTIKLESHEKRGRKTASSEVQTDDEPLSRPTSRLSERFGAISPAVHVFEHGPASHRIIPGGFRGCNYAAGMQQGTKDELLTKKIIIFRVAS